MTTWERGVVVVVDDDDKINRSPSKIARDAALVGLTLLVALAPSSATGGARQPLVAPQRRYDTTCSTSPMAQHTRAGSILAGGCLVVKPRVHLLREAEVDECCRSAAAVLRLRLCNHCASHIGHSHKRQNQFSRRRASVERAWIVQCETCAQRRYGEVQSRAVSEVPVRDASSQSPGALQQRQQGRRGGHQGLRQLRRWLSRRSGGAGAARVSSSGQSKRRQQEAGCQLCATRRSEGARGRTHPQAPPAALL